MRLPRASSASAGTRQISCGVSMYAAEPLRVAGIPYSPISILLGGDDKKGHCMRRTVTARKRYPASARRRVAKHRADIPLAADGAVAEQCVAGGIFRHGQNIAADSRRQPGVKLCRYAVARRDKLTAKCFFIRHAVTVR